MSVYLHVQRLLLGAVLGVSLAASAPATTVTFNFGPAEIVDGVPPGFLANATVIADFNPACSGTESSFCGLRITLRYNPTAGLPTQGQTLAGLLFEPQGTADFRDGPPGPNVPYGGVVGAKTLVGNGAATAAGELGLVTIGSAVDYIDVSAHWGLNPAIAIEAGFGTHFLGSIGDILGGLNVTASTLSVMQLFPGTTSSIEPNPPDGSRFAIVDLNSLPNGGFPNGNLAYVQDEIVANLFYIGSLTGLNLVLPVFGTEGNPLVPEPGTAVLMGMGLLGLMAFSRRVGRARG